MQSIKHIAELNDAEIDKVIADIAAKNVNDIAHHCAELSPDLREKI